MGILAGIIVVYAVTVLELEYIVYRLRTVKATFNGSDLPTPPSRAFVYTS